MRSLEGGGGGESQVRFCQAVMALVGQVVVHSCFARNEHALKKHKQIHGMVSGPKANTPRISICVQVVWAVPEVEF